MKEGERKRERDRSLCEYILMCVRKLERERVRERGAGRPSLR